jgi:hypothetical protein
LSPRPGSSPPPLYAGKFLANRGRRRQLGARHASLSRRWPCLRHRTACILAVRQHLRPPGSTRAARKPWPYRGMAAVPDSHVRRRGLVRLAVARHPSRKPARCDAYVCARPPGRAERPQLRACGRSHRMSAPARLAPSAHGGLRHRAAARTRDGRRPAHCMTSG